MSHENQCSQCGASISAFMMENHKRHCQNFLDDEDSEEEENGGGFDNMVPKEEALSIEDAQMSDLESAEDYESEVECEFCQIGHSKAEIAEHRGYCGSRTDTCSKCGKRDTLRNFELNGQEWVCPNNCNDTPNNPTSDRRNSLRRMSIDDAQSALSAPAAKEKMWRCPQCTLENPMSAKRCTACGNMNMPDAQRLARMTTQQQIAMVMEAVVDDMGGDEVKGLSSGEKRKLMEFMDTTTCDNVGTALNYLKSADWQPLDASGLYFKSHPEKVMLPLLSSIECQYPYTLTAAHVSCDCVY